MGKVFRYPMTYFDNETGKPYYLQDEADSVIDELRLENERLEEDIKYLKQESIGQVKFYSGLYQAIIKRVEPFFPKDTRELEWDVLPGTMYGLAEENARMKELLLKMNVDIAKFLKDME